MGGFMLYLYRASLLLLAITFALGLEKAPMAWAVLLLIPGTVSGFYVGVALHKEALDEMQAEEEEEFEYSDLVGPYFSRMVKEMFLVFLVGGLLAGAYGPSGFGMVETLTVLSMVASYLLVMMLGSAYSGLLMAKTNPEKGRALGLIGGLVFGVLVEVVIAGFLWSKHDENVLWMLLVVPTVVVFIRLAAKRPHPERVGKSSLLANALLCALALPLTVGFLAIMTMRGHRSGGSLTACKSNLKNIGTAMEMYSTDWSGKYPEDINMLTPNYLKTIPECPTANEITYTLQTGESAAYNDQGFKDYYFLQCEGENHTNVSVPANYPQYDGIQGLIER